MHEAENVRSTLNKYVAASKKIINVEKSTMLFSPNAQPGDVAAIQQILPFQVVENFDRFLGLPARIGRRKVEVFSYLKDRLWSSVEGLQEKNLSMAGKKDLIKSMLQAIPTYIMSCFFNYRVPFWMKFRKLLDFWVGIEELERNFVDGLGPALSFEVGRTSRLPGHGQF